MCKIIDKSGVKAVNLLAMLGLAKATWVFKNIDEAGISLKTTYKDKNIKA